MDRNDASATINEGLSNRQPPEQHRNLIRGYLFQNDKRVHMCSRTLTPCTFGDAQLLPKASISALVAKWNIDQL